MLLFLVNFGQISHKCIVSHKFIIVLFFHKIMIVETLEVKILNYINCMLMANT